MWVVIYCQYGVWSVTNGFATEEEANAHADKRLRRPEKDYVLFVELRYIELPDGAPAPTPRKLYDL